MDSPLPACVIGTNDVEPGSPTYISRQQTAVRFNRPREESTPCNIRAPSAPAAFWTSPLVANTYTLPSSNSPPCRRAATVAVPARKRLRSQGCDFLRRGVSLFTWSRPQFTRDGSRMHQDIRPERWCVTKLDLRVLRRHVRKAIKRGEIVPTAADSFDPADRVGGPMIYTVNEQFIVPVTARAGNMSWALMRHPEGLKCDLFVTHAWREGIFEFIDKVIASWPRMARHAWCCMLANPQNLAISDLIRNPSESPFAHALRESRYVLVVPNNRESIYTRLWCAYEAYLAHEWDKVILTAKPPIRRELEGVIPPACLTILLGVLSSVVGNERLFLKVTPIYTVTSYVLVIFTMLGHGRWFCRGCNIFGLFLCSRWVGLLCRYREQPSTFGFDTREEDWEIWLHESMCFSCAEVLYFVAAEFDRVRYEVSMGEAKKLQKGYVGSICSATCTQASDATNIWAEIGCRVKDVDRTIGCLIRAGMSSSRLRSAWSVGVDVKGFTTPPYAFLLLSIGFGVTTSQYRMVFEDVALNVIRVLSSVLLTFFIFFFYRSPPDAQIFACMVLQRCAVVVKMLPFMFTYLFWNFDLLSTRHMYVCQAFFNLVTLLLATAFSILGIDGVAHLPHCGRGLAQLFVARGMHGLKRACCLDGVLGSLPDDEGMYPVPSAREEGESSESDDISESNET